MRAYKFTNAIGEPDVMLEDEIAAIERSGQASGLSGFASWRTYANVRMVFEDQHAVLPLMEQRPGQTLPDHIEAVTSMYRHGEKWSYSELCALMKAFPDRNVEVVIFAKHHGRSPHAVESQFMAMKRRIFAKRITWDGYMIRMGRIGDPRRWPECIIPTE